MIRQLVVDVLTTGVGESGMTPGEKDMLRNDIADWLFQHEDDEHNALPHSEAADSVQVQYDAKVYGWADELLSGPLAALLAKLRAVEDLPS